MKSDVKSRHIFSAVAVSVIFAILAVVASEIMMWIFYSLSPNTAISILEGEFWGGVLHVVLLALSPLFVVGCFLAERIKRRGSFKIKEKNDFEMGANSQQRAELYQKQWNQKNSVHKSTPWIYYFFLCGLTTMLFAFAVMRTPVMGEIQRNGHDLRAYHEGKAAAYTGTLLRISRPVRDGILRVPDSRFYYYKSRDTYFRCVASMLPQPDFMQPFYEIEYLPNSGTIISITDSNGNLRTGNPAVSIPVAEGQWLYGDLAIPICSRAKGYESLSREQQALYDILYSQVLNSNVAEGEISTRSFYLPYPLKKKEFNEVLELYKESDSFQKYPMFEYRTDDEKTVKTAYCQRIDSTKYKYQL